MDQRRHRESTKKTVWVSWFRVVAAVSCAAMAVAAPPAQTDRDALMRDVLRPRDDVWRTLQSYVRDEHESFDLRGPARFPMWGERRDYTWYIRDGFFVRSPLKVNGAAVPEDERRKYEADFLQRQQRREVRREG